MPSNNNVGFEYNYILSLRKTVLNDPFLDKIFVFSFVKTLGFKFTLKSKHTIA